jgi:hypothetical protein
VIKLKSDQNATGVGLDLANGSLNDHCVGRRGKGSDVKNSSAKLM